MANFVPFKDGAGMSSSYKSKRVKGSFRKYADGAFSNFGNFNQCRSSLRRSASTPIPFFRLNSYGAEETDCARRSGMQSKSMDAGLNRIDHRGEASNKMTQVVDGIRGCYANFMKRDWKRSSLPSSYANTMPMSIQSFNAPVHQLSDYLNCCGTNVNVNSQLIGDLMGDKPCNKQHFIVRTEPSARNKNALSSKLAMPSKQITVSCNEPTSKHHLTDENGSSDEMPPKSRVCTGNVVLHRPESVVDNAFLVQTVQQRKSRELKKAARKRKRSRHGNGKSASSNSCEAAKQTLSNASTSIVNNLQRLFVSDHPSNVANRSLSFSDDDDNDSAFQVSTVARSRVRSDLHNNLGLDNSFLHALNGKRDDALSSDQHDEEEDDLDEIVRANMRWTEWYGDSSRTNGQSSSEAFSDNDGIKDTQLLNKVSFADGPLLVRNLLLDDAGEVRKGPWEEMAVDRMRFQRRIAETAKVLEPILDGQHRAKVLACRAIADEEFAESAKSLSYNV